MLWGGRREMATSSLGSNRWSAAMPQPNDLSRSLVALDHNSTIIAVVELSQSSWLVGGVVPGIERQPRPIEVQLRTMRALWNEANSGPTLDFEKATAACEIARHVSPYLH